MTCAWKGTIADLKELEEKGILIATIAQGFCKAYKRVSDSERRSWGNSLPALTKALASVEFDDLQVLIELQMPVGAERADVVLLGGQPQKGRALVIEFKQWSSGIVDAENFEVIAPNYERYQHPSVQALNYSGKLKMFHSLAAHYDLHSVVVLPNFLRAHKKELIKGLPATLIRKAPIICREEGEALAQMVRKHLLPNELGEDDCYQFDQAPYQQTAHLTDIITRHAIDIANQAVETLAEHGIMLSEDQELLVREVLDAIQNKKKQVFCIHGNPGSGKTLLAVTLLLRTLQQRPAGQPFNAALGMHNSRLKAILKDCFKGKETPEYIGSDGVLMFFHDQYNNKGLGDSQDASFDLVVCDEAQRMQEEIMSAILQRAPVVVLFIDENQRLNPSDQGTLATFEKVSNSLGKQYIKKHLKAYMRCRGGQEYHDWVENLLRSSQNKEQLSLANQSWGDNYLVGICPTAQMMLRYLKEIHERKDPGAQVALVASFTESPGYRDDINDARNIRVGYPLTSRWEYYNRPPRLCIRWLMKDDDYVKFWKNKGRDSDMGSNRLDKVASIYGAQGLECDYVGIFWGRDLIFRNGTWQLGKAQYCYDTIDELVYPRRARPEVRRWSKDLPEEEVLELVKNRYRIFLTRGIKGVLIFCEDEETRAHLLGLRSGINRFSKEKESTFAESGTK